MKHICATIFVFLFLPSILYSQDNFQHKKDSLLKVIPSLMGDEKLNAYEILAKLTFMNGGNVDDLLIFEAWEKEAISQNNIQTVGFAKRATITYLLNTFQYKLIIEKADNYLDFLRKNEMIPYYYDVYNSVIYAYFNSGAKEKALEEAFNLYTQAKQSEDNEGIQVALYTIGEIYAKTYRWKEAQEYFKKSIDQANKYDLFNPTKLKGYQSLVSVTITLKQINEVESLFAEWEKDIKRYEEQQDISGSMLYELYVHKLSFYGEMNDLDKVEYYCSLLEDMEKKDEMAMLSYYYWKTHLLMEKKEWHSALEYSEKGYKDAILQGRTQTKINFMIFKAQILSHLNRQDEGNELFGRAFEMKDSLSNLEFHAQLDELRTQYEVDRHISEKERNRNYFLFALGGCILLVIALGIYIYYSRKIVRKNRELIRKAQQWANVEPSLIIADTEEEPCDTEEEQPLKTVEPDETDKLLFAEIEHLINEGLYKESALSLSMLAGKTNRNPTYISKAVSRCKGKTFKTWLNEYRIKEAVRLLSDKNNPNISIETVAWDSGFNDRKTFYRIFKNITGLSPTDFKKSGLRK